MRTAICQVGHPSSLESLVVMLRAVGWECMGCSRQLREHLKELGCDTVLDPVSMAERWGMRVPLQLPEATVADLHRKDVVYVDIKAHRNGPKVWAAHPHLQDRTLWYRINGGRPVDVEGKGPELNPPCPILTPCLWYGHETVDVPHLEMGGGVVTYRRQASWHNVPRYAMWPPFARWDEFCQPRATSKLPPLCLVHNVYNWGHGSLVNLLRDDPDVKLRCCGGWGSPDGQILHGTLPNRLANTVAMIHLKSDDAPGYALYEALAAGCPVIVSRRLIDSCDAKALLEPGDTCLAFDRTDKEGQVQDGPCVEEIKENLEILRDPVYNRRIGEAGRERLRQVQWSPVAESSLTSLRTFLEGAFP